jgi:hypothetical protein
VRVALAVVLALHGLAHLVGFAGSWHLSSEIPYKTTVLAGRLDLGDAGIRAVGVFWLIAAIVFVVAAIAAVADRGWWLPVAVGVSIASFVLSVIAWPDSRIGVALNLVILIMLVTGDRFEWW